MTRPWWENPDPEIRFDQTVFDTEAVASRQVISREVLDDPAVGGYRETILRDSREYAIMAIERHVRVATVPSGSTVLGVEVAVPYAFDVPVRLPRTWRDRLLGRPGRVASSAISGTLHATARVRVDVNAAYRFPDFNVDTGDGVPTGEWAANPRPVVLTSVDTTPEHGPHAAVSHVLHRCPEPGCHHYLSSHVPADAAEFGGCTVGDCPCPRTYGDGPFL